MWVGIGKMCLEKNDRNMSQPSVGVPTMATRGHSSQITASLFWTLFPITLCPDCHASLFPAVSLVNLAHYIYHVLSAFVCAGFVCYTLPLEWFLLCLCVLDYLVFLPFALLDYCFWTLY